MSMGIVDRLISFVNPVEDGDAREQAAAAGDGRQKNLVISEPHSFDEVQELADSIRMNRPVILNTSQARSGHGQEGFGLHVRMYICLRRRPSEDIGRDIHIHATGVCMRTVSSKPGTMCYSVCVLEY